MKNTRVPISIGLAILVLLYLFFLKKRAKVIKLGTVALITGGSRGIGKQIALEFAKRNKNTITLIVVIRDNSEDKLRKEF